MSPAYSLLNSDSFQHILRHLSVVCFLVAVGITFVAFAYYGRGREHIDGSPEDQRWHLLFATWRDSLIITMLYFAEGMASLFWEFSSMASMNSLNDVFFAPISFPLIKLSLEIMMFVVAVLRIIAITRWLSQSAKAHSER